MFLNLDKKIRIQKLRGGTGSPCLRRLQMRKFLCRKITASFKLNLKADGPDCKMIFKFGKHLERLHSTRKQCRRIYICHFCIAKILVGESQTLSDLHHFGAGFKRNSFIFLYAIDCTNAKCYNFKKRNNVFGVFAQLVGEVLQ